MRRAAALLVALGAAVAPGAALGAGPDTTPPFLVRAVATSFTTIDVLASEPIDPASIQPGDFAVDMAGITRTVTGAAPGPDPSRIALTFDDAWLPADAGLMRLTAPGAIADQSGNPSGEPADVRVGGAPGDFVAPVITRFRLNPTRGVCFVVGPRCPRDRTAIIFHSTEDGDTYVTLFRRRKLIGERRYTGQPGNNYVRFDGKIQGRLIRPGLYRMYVGMEDVVGNRTPFSRQPHALFRVKRTHRRH